MSGAAPVEAAPGGTADVEKKEPERSAVTWVIATVTLFIVVFAVSEAVIKAAGWDTPVAQWITVIAAGLSAAGPPLVASKGKLGFLPIWMFAIAVVTIVVVVVLAWLLKSDQIVFSGKLTAETRSEDHSFRAHAGDEYLIVLTSSDDLNAQLRVSNGVLDLAGSPASDGRVVVSDVLVGGSWTVTVKAEKGSTGHYKVTVTPNAGQSLTVGETRDGESFSEPDFSKGYRVTLPRREKLYIGLEPTEPADLPVEMQILRANGFGAANPHRVGNRLEVFQSLDPGTYVISARSVLAQPGNYTLTVSLDAPSGTPTQSTLPTNLAVSLPHVVQEPQQSALDELSHAGLVAKPINVCSHSVGAGIVRQVVEYVNGEEIELDGLNGVTDAGRQVTSGSHLVVKVGTGEACA